MFMCPIAVITFTNYIIIHIMKKELYFMHTLFQDELRTDTRKKNLLILVLNYMHEEGYVKG